MVLTCSKQQQEVDGDVDAADAEAEECQVGRQVLGVVKQLEDGQAGTRRTTLS